LKLRYLSLWGFYYHLSPQLQHQPILLVASCLVPDARHFVGT
jgi:hypothetical protein